MKIDSLSALVRNCLAVFQFKFETVSKLATFCPTQAYDFPCRMPHPKSICTKRLSFICAHTCTAEKRERVRERKEDKERAHVNEICKLHKFFT